MSPFNHFKRLALLAAFTTLAACSTPNDEDEVDDEATVTSKVGSLTFTSGGVGVSRARLSDAPGVFIAYGGYTARRAYSEGWVEALSPRLRDLGVGTVYAVAGPRDAAYSAREIANSAITAELLERGTSTSKVVVAAHSSGAFVGFELLRQLDAAGALAEGGALRGRLSFFNLDGSGQTLPTQTLDDIKMYAVLARDPTIRFGESANAWAMRALAERPDVELISLEVPGTGCAVGARWCLHDALVTTRPHNPYTFDLSRDYRLFHGERRVVDDYLDALDPR
jgi:hypothetical protein